MSFLYNKNYLKFNLIYLKKIHNKKRSCMHGGLMVWKKPKCGQKV